MTSASGAAPRRTEVAAPAKLNLGLRVTGRRGDGYHELESLFVPIDWADDVAVEVESASEASVGLALAGAGAGVPADETNLSVRAARRFLEAADLRCAVTVALTKRLPVAAGLGGGSSDAGAVLRAMTALFPDALPSHRLAELALSLGADVPYFLDPRPARVTGVGERIEPLAGIPPMTALLVSPGVPLSTAEVFAAYDALHSGAASAPSSMPSPTRSLTETEPDPTIRPHLDRDSGPRRDSAPPSVVAIAHRLHNDLEAAATRLCPPIARLQERIRGAGAVGVGMSGSGPTVFGLFEDVRSAAMAQAAVTLEAPCWSRVASTLESR